MSQTEDRDLPTPRSTLQGRYVRVLLTCWHCKRQRNADLQKLVDTGRGDTPLIKLRWQCSNCHTDPADMVVTSKHSPQP